jgi:hypothetical protein
MKTKTEKTYDEFLEMVAKYNNQLGAHTETGWKYGQVFFNVLASVRPDLTEMIRGTMHDPFHHDTVSKETYDYLASKW